MTLSTPVASSSPPSPKQIAEHLGALVIGQPEAVREMSVALAKYLGGLGSGNILLIGSSGTGKTTLMRAVESYLGSDPALTSRSTVVRLHANVLGEEAREGRPGEAVIHRLLARAREAIGPNRPIEELLDRVAHGLVFVDEVDKIRASVGDRPNVAGIRAQEALLTVMENEAVRVRLPSWAGGAETVLDSSGIVFVCGGAFEGLYDAVYDRVTVGRDRGALKPSTVVDGGQVKEQLIFALRDWLSNDDLFDYGMTPQFLARFEGVVLLEDLGIDELVRIFLEAPDSAFKAARAYFESRNIHLALSPDAARRIATAAAEQPRLGARALREVFRRVIRDYEFDPEAAAVNGALLLDVAEVEEKIG